MCKTNVENAHHSTSLLSQVCHLLCLFVTYIWAQVSGWVSKSTQSQTILTSVLGTKYLHEILSDRHCSSSSF